MLERLKITPQLLYQLFHIVSERRLEPHVTPRHRVNHAELPGVQRLPRKVNEPKVLRTEDIPLFPDQRVSAQPGLQPDLVPSTGHQADLEH